MHKWTSTISRVLADKSGIDTSVAELMVSTMVKVAVTASLAGIIGGVTMFSAMASASTQNSSAFQTSDLQFAKAVHAADRIIGYDTGAVALLDDNGTSCDIDLWHGVSSSGTTALREDRSTVAQTCDNVAQVSLASTLTGADKVVGLTSLKLTYENIGGRAETFDSNGNVTLDSTATQPADVSDTDWADARPYKIDLTLASGQSNLTAFAKNTVMTGYANVVATPQAVSSPGSLRYVPPTASIPAAVNLIDVSRSTTTGAVYGGLHEGIALTFTGAQCPDGGASTIVTKFVTSSPAGVADVSQTQTAVLTGQAVQFQLAGVANGAQGTASVVASCTVAGPTTQASTQYTQTVPNPTVSVAESNPFSTHVVSWNQVSSLPTTFTGTWTGNDGTNGTIAATTGQSANVVHAAYGTYGVTDTYTITATVDGQTGSGIKAISHAWPAIPKATSFGRAENSLTPVKEHIVWGFTASCPVGTTIYAQSSEDRTGQANGSISNTVHHTSGYTANYSGYHWSPAYALQGYKYGIHVYTECVIDSTGASSPTQNVEYDWVTGMNTPGAPSWSSYNTGGYNGNAADTNRTKSASCTTDPSCGSWITIDYDAYCPAGSSVVGTHFTSYGWPGENSTLRGPFDHPWGYTDFWQNGTSTAQNVTYSNSYYSCQSPFNVLKQSNVSGNNIVSVDPE